MMTKYLSKISEFTQGKAGKPRYIGTLLFYIGFTIYVIIVGAGFGFLAIFLPTKINFKLINSFNYFIKFWLSFTCGVKYEFEGMDNFPQGPCVLVANHQSTWETLILQIVHVPTATVLKKELLSIPVFGWGLRAILPISIDRNRRREAKQIIHEQGMERISKGMSILIFPEGTRMDVNARKNFAPTGAKLAIDANIPVVPIAHNAGYVWRKGRFLKYSGTIKMAVGKPIMPTADMDVKELNYQTQKWIYAKLDEFQTAE